MNNASLLILAGGLGSRYQGQKQIDSVTENGDALMEFALYDAIQAGFRKYVFIVNPHSPDEFKQKLTEILQTRNCEVHFLVQKIDSHIPTSFLPKLKDRLKPLGTAHAVLCAKDVIKEPFLTMNADDFYGSNSFEIGYQSIQNQEITENKFGLLAFELQKTLSKNGSVSRGICRIENERLQGVEEFIGIEQSENVIYGRNENNQIQALAKDSKVSMNFWILHPSFFDRAEKKLIAFLESYQPETEFYLPSVLDKALQSKEIEIKVFTTNDKWFGLTYPQDKVDVENEIKKLQNQGKYPEELWT